MRVARAAVLLLLLLFQLPPVWAEGYILFDEQGRQSPDYKEFAPKLKPGDVIRFGNGHEYELGEKLGSGNTTLIFAIADQPERAIRIPKSSGMFDGDHRYVDFIVSLGRGEDLLARHDVPRVRVHEVYRGEYAIVQRVRPELTFQRFLHDGAISPRLRLEMAEKLVEFARKTATFESIGDFHPEQLVYHGPEHRWIILDWTHSHSEMIFDQAKHVRASPTLFLHKAHTGGGRPDFFSAETERVIAPDGTFEWKPRAGKPVWVAELANRVHSAIVDERLKILSSGARIGKPTWARNCLSEFLQDFLSQRE